MQYCVNSSKRISAEIEVRYGRMMYKCKLNFIVDGNINISCKCHVGDKVL